ncbi:MAG TPA: phosphotransferase [Nitrospira sp.]|nr:phosphotransferase [Nitrospira sp.]
MRGAVSVTRSILSVDALGEVVAEEYAFAGSIECQFFHWGLNDTYLLKTNATTYVLRVYRRGWRSLQDIQYELDALLHVYRAGIAVSAPVRKQDGTFVGTIDAPEGPRYLVLFTYAQGRQPTYEAKDDNAAYLYGKVVAQIHTATEMFQSPHRRVPLDLEHLIEAPLRSLQPMLTHRPEDWRYVQTVTEQLRQHVTQLPLSALDRGFCHGDLHWGNAHVQGDNGLTLFDFDCCGVGWRAYDLAVFRWAARLRKKEQDQWPAFLRGYRDERDLYEKDIQAVPYFVAIRHVWLLGLHAEGRQDWGVGWMDNAYFDQAIKFLREWETEHLGAPNRELDR